MSKPEIEEDKIVCICAFCEVPIMSGDEQEYEKSKFEYDGEIITLKQKVHGRCKRTIESTNPDRDD